MTRLLLSRGRREYKMFASRLRGSEGKLPLSVLVAVAAVLVACGSLDMRRPNESVFARNDSGSLAFSTFIGGSNEDTIRDMTADDNGNIYVTGGTASPDFPVTPGAYDGTFNGRHDVFVAKLDSGGNLIWSTFIGGPNYDRAYAIKVDSNGYVYVAGRAGLGYPTTVGCVQPGFGGDINPNALYGPQDGFVSKLSPDGSRLIWSTYFGSDDNEVIRDIAIDESGAVYVGVASVARPHPHITAGSFQTVRRGPSDGVVAKISSDGSRVLYASYFGGSGDDGGNPSVRVDAAGHLFYLTHTRSADAPVTTGSYMSGYPGGSGPHLILAKFDTDGSRLLYSTYFGGNGIEFTETHGLAIDSAGNAYIAFTTTSNSLPIPMTIRAFQSHYGGSGGPSTGRDTNYPGDVFLAKLSPDGTQLLAGTYLGGRFGEGAEGIAIDNKGNVCISGATYSDNFPVTDGAIQKGLAGQADLFAVTLTGDLEQLVRSSYLGGNAIDYGRTAAVDSLGNLYVAGMSMSANWPTTGGAIQRSYRGDWDAVIAKIAPAADTPSALPKITNASVKGKKLIIIGENFGDGAEILLDDEPQKKTHNDHKTPTTRLIAKRAGKRIAVGATVTLQVRNPDGTVSNVFNFTRPPGN
jgi:Beta-propeller repeat